ncbi:MAG: FAD-dependent oxidoreductase [bacterium]
MESQTNKHFQVAILGGGITGSSIFHTLNKYTNLESICLFEKCADVGLVNSHGSNNSQTLHFGDIETNYSEEKAKATKSASEMVVRLLKSLEPKYENLYKKSHKLALAVGQEEVDRLTTRYENFKNIFPELELISKERIGELEPEILNGRAKDTPLAAFYSDKSYIIDFGQLAKALANETKNNSQKKLTSLPIPKLPALKKILQATKSPPPTIHLLLRSWLCRCAPTA